MNYISEEQDALATPWKCIPDGVAFCNPPYSQLYDFVKRAKTQFYDSGNKSLVLVPVDPSTRWWRYYALKATQIRFLIGGKGSNSRYRSGRVQFDSPPGIKKSSNMWPSAVLEFTANIGGLPKVIWWDWRNK